MKSCRTILLFSPLAIACAPPAPPTKPAPVAIAYVAPQVGLNDSGLDTALVGRLDKLVKEAMEDAVAPAVGIAVGRNGKIAYMKGYGHISWDIPSSPAVDTNTLFDLASVTKVVATTTLAMIMEEAGQLDLDRTVNSYLPEFNSPEKLGITVRQLLTHNSGLEAGGNTNGASGREAYLRVIN
ncbi:MAG TPA: serine hydrolase domain-containing protein, partial [Gemmatimonadaceae bacterium]|nr:serine hydrolase domain-containing protein [Gemmatimonadaceae bacterium]